MKEMPELQLFMILKARQFFFCLEEKDILADTTLYHGFVKKEYPSYFPFESFSWNRSIDPSKRCLVFLYTKHEKEEGLPNLMKRQAFYSKADLYFSPKDWDLSLKEKLEKVLRTEDYVVKDGFEGDPDLLMVEHGCFREDGEGVNYYIVYYKNKPTPFILN